MSVASRLQGSKRKKVRVMSDFIRRLYKRVMKEAMDYFNASKSGAFRSARLRRKSSGFSGAVGRVPRVSGVPPHAPTDNLIYIGHNCNKYVYSYLTLGNICDIVRSQVWKARC